MRRAAQGPDRGMWRPFGQPAITSRSGSFVNRQGLAVASPTRPRATVFSPVDNWPCGAVLPYNASAFPGDFSTHAIRPLATRLRTLGVRAARPAIQHLDPAPSRCRCRRQRRRRGRHRAGAESLQARLDPQPICGAHRNRPERARGQAGPARRHPRAARRRRTRRRPGDVRRPPGSVQRRAARLGERRGPRRGRERSRSARAERRRCSARQRHRSSRRQRRVDAAVAQPAQPGADASTPSFPAAPTRWRAPLRSTSPARPASCTTRSSSTAASASARRT